MSKFIRISQKLSKQEISQTEQFLVKEQKRLEQWRKVDIMSTLEKANLSTHIDGNSIKKLYYGLSKLIIDIQSELINIERNLTHAKSLSILPHNTQTYNDVKQAYKNVEKHIESYKVKILQIQTIWSALMNLALSPQENLFV